MRPRAMTLAQKFRHEIAALTFPARHSVKYRLHTLANDALERTGRERRLPESLSEQWRRILGRSPALLEGPAPAGAPRILFGSVYGAVFITRATDAVLAAAVRLRGANVFVLSCDESLPACELNALGNGEPDAGEFGSGDWRTARRAMCQTCMVLLGESHTLPGCEHVSLAAFARPGDVDAAHRLSAGVSLGELRDFVYGGIHVGEHAYSSLLRTTLRGVPVDDERTRFLARRLLAACIVLVDRAGRLFDHVRPDCYVAESGIYVSAGVYCEIARSRNVRVVVHGLPPRKGTVWLSHGMSYHQALIQAPNKHWEGLQMTGGRARTADEYLAQKHFVARDYASYHVDAVRDESKIREALGLDERPIISVYTNILWDAQLYYRFNVFSNMLEWLFETIRYYARRPDLQLVIRLHPAEAPGGLPTNQPLAPELDRAFPTLPENVRVVRPESKVSSYALGAMSSAALVYGARVGVELVMLGTPVIVAGEAFMRGKGFTFDPTTREEYFALLGRAHELPRVSEADRERARKWYYYYFFRLMMPFPFCDSEGQKGFAPSRLAFQSLEELLPGRSPVLDRACQGIMDGVTAFEWDEFEGADAAAPRG
jgi:hypothetical protein